MLLIMDDEQPNAKPEIGLIGSMRHLAALADLAC